MSMTVQNTLENLYQDMIRVFADSGLDTPDLDARFLLESRGGFTWSAIISAPDTVVPDDLYAQLQRDIERRVAGEPVSRILGQSEFWGLPFYLSPDTLDPRPDTEVLVRAVLNRYGDVPTGHILDLGTGTGCILIALLSEWGKSCGTGVDKSIGALRTARQNAALNGVSDRVRWINGHWADALGDQSVDVLVSNPPYIVSDVIQTLESNVKNHDPILALDGGLDGLDPYKYIFTHNLRVLKPGGRAFFEIGYDHCEQILRIVEDSRSRIVEVYPDIAGIPRVVEVAV